MQGSSCANVFHHAEKQVHCSVHGDDSTSEGPKLALDWFETSVAERCDITISPRLGPGPTDAKECTCLNRVVRWCGGRIEYEAGPRQAEKLIAECVLEGAKTMVTTAWDPAFMARGRQAPGGPPAHGVQGPSGTWRLSGSRRARRTVRLQGGLLLDV